MASSGAGGGRRCNAVIFCALPLSLLPSPPLSLSRSSAPWVQAVGLALVFGWALALHGRRRSRFPGLGRAGAPLLALRPLRLCWVLALPCVLWRWLSPGSCWPLLGVDCLGAAGCWLWLRLGFPGSRLSALVQGWRVSRPCRWWWLGWVMGRRWAWWLAYPVRQIAQIKPCRFGYYSREKR